MSEEIPEEKKSWWEREIFGNFPGGYAFCRIYDVVGNPPELYLCWHESCGSFWAKPSMGSVGQIEADDTALVSKLKDTRPAPVDTGGTLVWARDLDILKATFEACEMGEDLVLRTERLRIFIKTLMATQRPAEGWPIGDKDAS